MWNKRVLRHSECSSFKPSKHSRYTEILNSSANSYKLQQFHCSLAAIVKTHRNYCLQLGNLAYLCLIRMHAHNSLLRVFCSWPVAFDKKQNLAQMRKRLPMHDPEQDYKEKQ